MAFPVPSWALPTFPGLRNLPHLSTRFLLPASWHQGTKALPSACLLPSRYVQKPSAPHPSWTLHLFHTLPACKPTFVHSLIKTPGYVYLYWAECWC